MLKLSSSEKKLLLTIKKKLLYLNIPVFSDEDLSRTKADIRWSVIKPISD